MKRYRYKQLQRSRGMQFSDDLIDATHTRDILRGALRRKHNRVRLTELAQWTGMSRNSIMAIHDYKTKRVRRGNAEAILRAIQDADILSVKDNTRVDATRTKTVVLGLCAQGWSIGHQREILQNNLGVSGGFIPSVVSHGRKWTYKKNADYVEWLAKNIGNRTGPNKQSAYMMRARGIFPVEHYGMTGTLLRHTLSAEQRAVLERVQSSHG